MGDDDNDRAAILARRQRFIALALSGLACTSTEPAGDARPNVCLKKMMPREGKPEACLKYSIEPRPPKPDPELDPVPEPTPTDTANPNACLSIAPPEPPPTPTPCLSAVPKTPPPKKAGE